jgi:hypothetical protein
MLALALRTLLLVYVATVAFSQISYWHPVETGLAWCWHEVLPDVPSWLGFAEDPVAHATVAVARGRARRRANRTRAVAALSVPVCRPARL